MKRKMILAITVLLLAIIPISIWKATEVHKTDYKLEEISEDSILFVYRYRTWEQDEFWVISKSGKCKVLDFVNEEKYKYIHNIVDKEELLVALEQFFKDSEVPEQEQRLQLNDEQKEYCMNVSKIRLIKRNKYAEVDAADIYYYAINGIGESRKMVLLRQGGTWDIRAKNKVIDEIFDKIDRFRYDQSTSNK